MHDSFHTENLENPTDIKQRYRILRRIGVGGSGLVYLAQDLELDRKVAIKTADTTLHQNNLDKEAQYHAKAAHSNIATLIDYVDRKYLVTEYIQGKPLDLNKMTSQIAEQIERGLNHLHQSDIAHNDLHPGNILVTDSGQVKIIDFSHAAALTPKTERKDRRAFKQIQKRVPKVHASMTIESMLSNWVIAIILAVVAIVVVSGIAGIASMYCHRVTQTTMISKQAHHLRRSRRDLKQTQQELKQTQQDLKQTQQDLKQTQQDLEQATHRVHIAEKIDALRLQKLKQAQQDIHRTELQLNATRVKFQDAQKENNSLRGLIEENTRLTESMTKERTKHGQTKDQLQQAQQKLQQLTTDKQASHQKYNHPNIQLNDTIYHMKARINTTKTKKPQRTTSSYTNRIANQQTMQQYKTSPNRQRNINKHKSSRSTTSSGINMFRHSLRNINRHR